MLAAKLAPNSNRPFLQLDLGAAEFFAYIVLRAREMDGLFTDYSLSPGVGSARSRYHAVVRSDRACILRVVPSRPTANFRSTCAAAVDRGLFSPPGKPRDDQALLRHDRARP